MDNTPQSRLALGRLCSHCIQHPLRTVVFGTVLVLAIAPGLLRLELRTDGRALVPPNAPAIQDDEAIREEFGIYDALLVLVRTDRPDGIFNARTLSLIRTLTSNLPEIAGIDPKHVISLATEPSDRVRPGTLEFRAFLDPPPTTSSDLERLRGDLDAFGIYTGTLVSRDASAAAIWVGVPPGIDRIGLCNDIGKYIATMRDVENDVQLIGAPAAEALLGSHILGDLGVPARLLRSHAIDRAGGATAPRSLYELRIWIGRNIGLVPLVFLVIALLFLACFRSGVGVALPISEVISCLVVVFGLMGWLGVPIYITTTIIPVILVPIGLSDEIHVFNRFAQLRRGRPAEDARQLVCVTLAEMQGPIVRTSLTTAIGFASFALSPMPPMRAFGLFAALGVLFCMFWSLTVIPSLLVLLQPRVQVPMSPGVDPAVRPTLLARLGMAIHRHPWPVLGGTGVTILLLGLGIPRIIVQDSWIDGFAPDGDFYRTTQFVNDQFEGTHTLIAVLDTHGLSLSGQIAGVQVGHYRLALAADSVPNASALVGCTVALTRSESATGAADILPERWSARIESVSRNGDALVLSTARRDMSPERVLDPQPQEAFTFEITARRLTSPEVLREIDRFETFVGSKEEYAVGGILGPGSLLSTTRFIALGRNHEARQIPDDPDEIRWLWSQYGRIRGADRLRALVDDAYGRTVVSVFLKNANFRDTRGLVREMRTYEREHLAPLGVTMTLAGDVLVSQTLIDAIVTTQLRSLLLSVVGLLVVTIVLHRSVRWGVYAVVPCIAAVTVTFAIMGWTRTPLGVATSMFAAIILGIGVDYAIHLIDRYRRAASCGLSSEAAVVEALNTTAPAILIDGAAVALGFGVLTLSQVPANARLGQLTGVCVITCLAATLLVMPALFSLAARWPHRAGRAGQ